MGLASRIQKAVIDRVTEALHDALAEAVKEHVQSQPTEVYCAQCGSALEYDRKPAGEDGDFALAVTVCGECCRTYGREIAKRFVHQYKETHGRNNHTSNGAADGPEDGSAVQHPSG